MKKPCLFMFLRISFPLSSLHIRRRLPYIIKDDSSEVDFRPAKPIQWGLILINGKIKLITHLCCLFSTILGSLSQEMLYYHLYCNSKGYFSSSEAYWLNQPQEVFYKKCVFTNFSKFTGKHLRQTLLQVFPLNFSKLVGPLFFTKHLWATACLCI